MENVKTCSKCEQTKPLGEFLPKRRQCKSCWKIYYDDYYQKKGKFKTYKRQPLSEKQKEYTKIYYQKQKEKKMQEKIIKLLAKISRLPVSRRKDRPARVLKDREFYVNNSAWLISVSGNSRM